MMIFDTWREARKIAKQKRIAKADADERAKIAKIFNDRYTYCNLYDPSAERLTEGSAMYGIMPKGGNAWMCPDCNKIHMPYECSVFDGIHFKACCSTKYSGNRLSMGIKTL